MADVKIAFYKGRRRAFNRLVSWWTRGPYSHTELVIDGVSYSSSFTDGGVRAKVIEYDPEHWDVVDAPWVDAEAALAWFRAHEGRGYDLLGLVGFVLGPVEEDKARYFCSEAVATMAGFLETWRFHPNAFAAVVHRFGAQEKK